ncbi:MAG: argininosuccinate synthase [Chloroflexi bacterium]|nr:argininosuccinate synthase [Chloroflexota bacterium]
MADKVVLAYSGGLDTSVAVCWIKEKYGLDVVTLTVNLGGEGSDAQAIKDRAKKCGAVASYVMDIREKFVKHYIFPALQANAMYEGVYPLATALGRPLIAKTLVEIARKEHAVAVAHGCTGKGNDQVRFDVAVQALAPDLKVIAPAREWDMTDRKVEIEYAKKHGIPVPVTVNKIYSVDENLWGRSIEGGLLEDAMREPPEEIYAWTKSPKEAPAEPGYLEIGFDRGLPVSIDGETLDGVSLIQHLNEIAGKHGIGRIDHIENRLVGIKSRENYEAPAAVTLLAAHQGLEALTLSKDQQRFKALVAQQFADLIYNGLWFSAMRQDLYAYVRSTQRYVSGTVRLRLHKGVATVVGRESKASLYHHGLSTYGKGDSFDHSSAKGFIHLWGLPVRTQGQAQPGTQSETTEE